MRILLIDSGRSWRGGQHQVAVLARGLRDRGIAVRVAAPPAGGLAAALEPAGIPVVPWMPRNDLDLRAARALMVEIRRSAPDLVHAHDARGHAIARLCQLAGLHTPLIVTRGVAFPPRGWLKYRRGVTRYLAVSHPVREALLAAGVSPDTVDLVPCGVPEPPPGERPADLGPHGVPAGEPVILTVAALTEEKGIGTVIRAAALSARRGLGLHWLIAGDGPLRPALERLARDQRAPVTLLGYVPEIGPYLLAADVLVHSPATEGFGIAVVEALARGVPAVVTRVGGLPDIVRSADLGSVVSADDHTAVLAGVQSLLEDPWRLDVVRQAGPLAAARFGVDRMVEGTMQSYRVALRQSESAIEPGLPPAAFGRQLPVSGRPNHLTASAVQ